MLVLFAEELHQLGQFSSVLIQQKSYTVMCFLSEIVSSSGSGASVGSEMLVDKSRLAPKVFKRFDLIFRLLAPDFQFLRLFCSVSLDFKAFMNVSGRKKIFKPKIMRIYGPMFLTI